MFDPAPPPTGSTIERIDEGGEIRLRWYEATMNPVRIFHLGITVLILVTACIVIPMALFMPGPINGPQPPQEFVLIALVIPAVFAAVFLGPVLVPRQPESITLGDDRLTHDTGSPPLPLAAMVFFGAIAGQFATLIRRDVPPTILRRRRRTLLCGAISNIRLDRVGERQRLTLDHGAERIEIGACLREPEREWLAGVLQQWYTDERR